jgi:hypothetical protein
VIESQRQRSEIQARKTIILGLSGAHRDASASLDDAEEMSDGFTRA